ncbi:MAG: MBL fold metallo-hydrolase [Candidatus Aminicenantes bacterium]
MILQPVLIGGGYYLWHNGKGVAIDPGHEFVDVLHRYHKLTVYHIDTVVITHDHMDHHADLETIINLRRGASSELKIVANREVIEAYGLEERQNVQGVNIEVVDVNPGENDLKLADGVTATILPCMHWQRVRTLHFDEKDKLSVGKMLQNHFNAFGMQLTINGGEKRILISGDTLFPIREDSKSDNWTAYGGTNYPYADDDNGRKLGWRRIEFSNARPEIMSDMEVKCKQMIDAYKALDKSDIVCLHLGSLEKGFANDGINLSSQSNSIKEAIVNNRHNPALGYQGFHLGLMGALRLLEVLTEEKENGETGFDADNGLIVLTEFGEELLGNRQNLCVILSQLAQLLPDCKGIQPSVIPSEITLHVRLDSQIKGEPTGILCSYCNKIHDWRETIGEEGPGEIIHYLVKGAANGYHPNCSYLK